MKLFLWIMLSTASALFGIFIGQWMSVSPKVTCSSDVVNKILSPSKEYNAIVYKTHCGATTNFRYKIGFQVPHRNFDMSQDYFFSIESNGIPYVSWNNKYSITVTYKKQGRVFRKAVIWDGDVVNYVEK